MKGRGFRVLLLLTVVSVATALEAGFASTESYLAAVGRVPGAGGAQFYTTVWLTNLTTAPQTFTFAFLKGGQSNPSPASFHDTLAPGETKVYENVVETKLGLHDALGAARITSSGELFVAERIYNQRPGDDLGNTEGLFFAGVPKSFSISSGQSASIQGVDQGGAENFRYNFALIETGGGSPTVNVQVFDGSGTMLGQKAYPLSPYEQIQPSVSDVVPGIHTTNARITATVTQGPGSIILAGAQLANESQDSSGFEMTFPDSLLGTGGGTAGVTSLNGLTGALTLTSGSGISITPSGKSISIAYTGGGGAGGITSVTHDGSLSGAGTGVSPLAIANGQVVRSVNGLHDNLTLAAGSNVTITPNGSTLTIASASGGGGGLTLPFSGTTSSSDPAFSVTNTGSGDGIQGTTSGSGGGTAGVSGTCPTNVPCMGILGTGQTGLAAHGTATGVYAETTGANSVALYAINDASSGYIAHFENGPGVDRVTIDTGGTLVATSTNNNGAAIQGISANNAGVSGYSTDSHSVGVAGQGYIGTNGFGTKIGVYGTVGSETGYDGTAGVFGDSYNNTGVLGVSGTGPGVFGQSYSSDGVRGIVNNNAAAGVSGTNYGGGYGVYGTSVSGYAVYGAGNFGSTGGKWFVEPHPTDPTKEIRYVCLEGRESGTYFRGSGRIVGGFAKIQVPEDFRAVSSKDGLTVVAMPVGSPAMLVCLKKSLDEIVIQGSSDVEFDYMVNGVRKAFEGFQPISENRDFVPRSPDDRLLTTGLPAESVRRLKANGILNADGSINLETAHRLGWDEQDSWKRADAEEAKR